MSEIEIIRAHQLALAAHHVRFVGYAALFALAAIIAVLALVRWRARRKVARAKRSLLRAETARHEAENARYDEIAWGEFCDRNELPQSTRITLMAGVRKAGGAR